MSKTKAAVMIAENRATQRERAESAAARAARKTAAETFRPSRGAVDAPGKQHRKPPPDEVINKRMGEPVGKQMGQKSGKNAMRRGRG